MIENLKRIVAPVVEAVSLKEVKDFLRVTNNDEDQLLVNLIYSITELVQKHLNRSLITQTWQLTLARYPAHGDRFKLYYGPVQSITTVTSHRNDQTDAIFDSTIYYLSTQEDNPELVLHYSRIFPTFILRPSAGVDIVYISGYGDNPDDVPNAIRQGIISWVTHVYENREDVVMEMPALVKTLLHPYIKYHF
jgi:uncharacterized phiE125 gp8 family phage protein